MSLQLTTRFPSTDSEIKRIEQVIPAEILLPGKNVLHEELERVLDLTRDQSRYRSVTGRWRRLLQEQHGIVLKAVQGEGFRVLTEAEKVSKATGQIEGIGRAIIRTGKTLQTVDTSKLSGLDRGVYNHQTKRLSILASSADQKRFKAPLPSLEDSTKRGGAEK